MDRLAMNAMLAQQAGVSYGKWKAMQPIVDVVPTGLPEGFIKCEYCGKAFKKKYGKRFCDLECRDKAYRLKYNDRKREYMRQYRAKKGQKKDGK